MRPSKAFAVITFLTLLSSFSIALSPTNASEDHSQHLNKLAVPNGVVTVPDSTSTVLRFSAIPNATSYKVRVYAAKGENPLRTIAPFNSGESISALTPNSTYKITVQAIGNGVRYSNSEESRKVSVTTLSALAVPAFSLNPTVMTATVGQLFNSPTPVSIGGAIANFSIDAGIFPINGLSFNTSTGVISGTPITAWIPNTYTITAHNSSGVALQSFTLITQAAPTVPNVSGLIRSAANASLIASGFVAGAVTTTTSGATSLNDGHVQSQSPTAGSALAAGGSVAFVLYTYVAPISTPTVTSISPISGTTAGGKAVTITGTGFTLTITSVTIGGVAATSVVRVSATSITAVTPAHVAGAVDVVVTNSDTGVGTGTGLYAYVAPLVPDLTALLEGAATSALTTNGFVKGSVTTTTSGANPGNNGLVQSQTPTAGSALTAGGSVDLVLYEYVAPTVPDLSGLLDGSATSALVANGFVKGSITTTDVGATALNDGQVKSQTPTAGSVLAAGGLVAVVVYAYVAPTVPDLVGKQGKQIYMAFRYSVFVEGTITYVTLGATLLNDSTVISQTPIAGSMLAAGGAIDLVVYQFVPAPVPSFSGLTLAAGTDLIAASGFRLGPVTTTTVGATLENNGKVASQNPIAGFDLAIYGFVGFVLYEYVAPTVPDLSGLLDGSATSALVANGFVKGSITTTDVGATALNDGQVKSQTPTAGSVLAAGNSVAVVVYAYVAPAPPVVTAAHTPALGGTATATDTFTGGMWSLSATPAAGYTFTSWACSNGAFVDNASLAETFVTPGSDITCNATFSAVTLTSIWISTLPTKLLYAIGDDPSAFEIAGLVVTRGFSDGSSVVFPGITLSNIDFTHWDSSTRVPYSLFPMPGVPLIITGLGIPVGFFVYFEAYVAPAPPVVTAAGAPSLGGTATATDINLDGIWDLIATPAVGYTFTSWGCDASQIPASTSTATTTVTPSANTTCIATFTAATTYSVTYYGNVNDSTVPLAMDGPYIEAADVTVMDSSGLGLFRTGYSFAGWNTQADGRGAPTPQPGYPTFPMPAANVDLYAQWVNNTFNITWSDNGGAGTSGGDSTYIGGSQITGFPTMLPTYSGFKFIGWNTSSDGLGTDVSSGYMPRIIWPNSYSDITLYAKWANNTFNITWDQNFNPNTQGHWPSSGDSTYVGGSAVVMPMQPVQDGYAFAAWQASDSSTSVSFSYVPIAPFGDITFTAVWTAIDISVDPILDAGPMNPWTYWDGGQSLTLTGSGFIAGTTVTIGGSNASITSLTDTSITVLTPIANDPGHMTVVVTSPNGSSASTTYFYQIT